MKPMTFDLLAYLNGMRPATDVTLYKADCFTIWLANKAVLTYTTLDIPVSYNGFTYQANSVIISGLRYKATRGLSVDLQKIQLSARPTDTFGGIPILQAIAQGLLDGAEIQRETVFFPAWNAAPLGSIVMFKGRVSSIDEIGRTAAAITVASDLVLLDIDMPRNVAQANCLHVLFDSGCGIPSGAYSGLGTVEGGSTQSTIAWSLASSEYAQGTIVFTNGPNTGVEANIKNADSSNLYLSYPLPNAPVTGDNFVAAKGCDHTQATCASKFNNLARFRGFPYVPPPQVVTGPLSNTSTGGKGGKR